MVIDKQVLFWSQDWLILLFLLTTEMEGKQQRWWELHLFLNNMSDFFAMLDNSFHTLKEHVPSSYVIDNVMATDTASF